jgi:hypothetical protein
MKRAQIEDTLAEIIEVMRKRGGGGTIVQIAAGLTTFAPQRKLQRWLRLLVQQRRIVRTGATWKARYVLADELDNELPLASPEGQAVWRLVTQPLAVRVAADYRRIVLDTYRPNQTYYIPADIRAQLSVPIAVANGAPVWRDTVVLGLFLLDFAWRSCWLEAQAPDSTGVVLSQPEVAEVLAQPDALAVGREGQFARNQVVAFKLLLTPECQVLSPATFGALYTALFRRMAPDVLITTSDLPAIPVDMSSKVLRTVPIALPSTMYRPPADAWLIDTCFEQILASAGVINDPVEQSFFVFMHLLYLQPFTSMNASLASLAANIPLVRAGRAPIHFGAVRGGDLLAAMRGVWELARPDLLRDLYVAAALAAMAALPRP